MSLSKLQRKLRKARAIKEGKLVKTFSIYNERDETDPLVQEMDQLLRENPTYFKRYWHIYGPCSNWGIDVYRPLTEEEISVL